MKPVVPPALEPLEPRVLLSATMEMRDVPLEAQPVSDNAIVVAQEPQVAAFALSGSFSMSGSIEVIGVIPGEPWTPYTPTAEQTTILFFTDGVTRRARVTLTLPHSGFAVDDWGAVSRDGNQFSVDAEVTQRPGEPEGDATTLSYDYDLGTFAEAGDYVFSFNACQQFVTSQDFAVTSSQWLPYLRIGDHAGIAIIQEDGRIRARVTIQFPDSGYRVQNWGQVHLEGTTLVVNMDPERKLNATILPAFSTVVHEYDLGELPGEGYLFEIRAWDQFAMARGFATAHVLQPVYRFWSPVNSRHFYTIDTAERDKLLNQYAHVWTYEGTAFYAYAGATQPHTSPVYRFWSPTLNAHFYTMNEAERDSLLQNYPNTWTYEGVAFYAYTQEAQPIGMHRVYRFWSGQSHFFTANDDEADKLHNEWSHVWTPEGIAWYVCGL